MQVNFSPLSSIKQRIELKKQARLQAQQADVIEIKSKKTSTQKKEPWYKRFKTAIAATLSSVVTGLAVMFVAVKKTDKLTIENQELRAKNDELKWSNDRLDETCTTLERENSSLRVGNEIMCKHISTLEEELSTVSLPENFEADVNAKLSKLNQTELPYSPTTRLDIAPKYKMSNHNPVIEIPATHEKTTNRSDAKKLDYPIFLSSKPYSFEFPTSDEIKVSHETVDVTPIPRTATTISESYADSLVWDNNKIARDLLQNFYDGHGQTLDGVKFNVTPKENGKYTVRIEGKSTFSPDKAILLGETSKRNNDKAAGNYGEGLKMVVLKLLREKGAENVDIASGNWNVNWQMQDCGLGKKVLAYQLDKVPTFDGNYIEFDTDNRDFIETIIKTFDRFYHHNNPAFTCPDFENDTFGIKFTENGEKGKFFIAGQAFEVDASYEGLTGMNIFIKNKPPVKYNGTFIFDPSRDRTSLNKENLSALGEWLVSRQNMTKEDVVDLLSALKDYWDVGGSPYANLKYGKIKEVDFIRGIFEGAYYRQDLNLKFPNEKDVAATWGVSEELLQQYISAGYRICNSYLENIGMRSVKELVTESRKHIPLEPTESEKNKILILREAIQLFSSVLIDKDLFSSKEIEPKIYIFDRKSEKEDKAYENVYGEAIVEAKNSLGFWLDRTYLNEADFSTVLGTSLHELTHKFGGDESSIFSYKLTDVMKKVFAAINANPSLAIKLKVLEKAWKEQE